jgi:hypothetical protein
VRIATRIRKQGQELQQARAQSVAQQTEIARIQQEQKWVVAGDMLFPEGSYELNPKGMQALNQYVPKFQGLQNPKIVVYGYTDNKPIGAALQRAGVANTTSICPPAAPTMSPPISPRRASIPIFCLPKGSAIRIRSPQTTRRKAALRIAVLKSCWRAQAPDARAPSIGVVVSAPPSQFLVPLRSLGDAK